MPTQKGIASEPATMLTSNNLVVIYASSMDKNASWKNFYNSALLYPINTLLLVE
jgi:hypothetical protein